MKVRAITKSLVTVALGLLLAISLIGVIMSTPKTSASAATDADNMYLIPINGYADFDDHALSGTTMQIWMTTNYGLGEESKWQGLGQYSFDGWQPFDGSVNDARKMEILTDMCNHILINGKTMQEIRVEHEKSNDISLAVGGTAVGRVIFHWHANGKIGLFFHTSTGDGSCLQEEHFQTVTIKKGFQWYSKTGVALGTGTDQDYTMYYDRTNNQWVRQLKQSSGEIASDAVTMLTGPAKTTYYKGDTFDKTGLSFKVTYEDKDDSEKNRTETIPASKVIVGNYAFDAETETDVQVPVYVNGKTVNVPVHYNPISVDLTQSALDGITVELSKNAYVMDTDKKVTGVTLKNVKFTDGTTSDVVLTDECINAPVIYEGKCTGYINYLNLVDFPFEYNVSNVIDGTPISLEIDSSNYQISQATVNNRLGFKVNIPGSTTSRKAIENVQLAKWLDADGEEVSIGDFLYINGESWTQLKSEYRVRKLLAYGDTLMFDPYNNTSEVKEDKVPADFVVSQADVDNGDYPASELGFPKNRITYDKTFTIELKAGFAYVTADKDSWGLGTSEQDSKNYYPVPGGYLKNDVLLVRYPATSSLTRWMRPLALKESTAADMVDAVLELGADPEAYTKSALDELMANVADDAAVVTSKGIEEFEVGDEYDAEGLEVTVKYLDGGSDVLTFNSAAVRGFDSEQAGECELSVTVNQLTVKFTVTVKEKATSGDNNNNGGNNNNGNQTQNNKKAKGCKSSVGAASLAAAAILLAAAIVIFIKRRKNEGKA